MEKLIEILPFLIPVVIVELLLMVTALVHVLRHRNYKVGSRALWIPVVVLLQIIGPIAYFIFGRSDD